MTDWRRGGWTGSINAIVDREIKEHFKANLVARRARYSFRTRLLKWFFANRTCGAFLIIYIAIDGLALFAEMLSARYISCIRPDWPGAWQILSVRDFIEWMTSCVPPPWLSVAPTDYINSLLFGVQGYLIGAQVGALGVLSLALALVTLIAQGRNSETDVKVYYYEAMAFEIVASSLALLCVLCAQLLWPGQSLLQVVGLGGGIALFKVVLLAIHLGWLLANIAALAHFISVTFGFVQQSRRQRIRELYTANVVMPKDMRARLRHYIYSTASASLLGHDADASDRRPSVTFGYDYGKPYAVEISTHFKKSAALTNVRMIWVRWVVVRWIRRCLQEAKRDPEFDQWSAYQAPSLCFVPILDAPRQGLVSWCVRRDGVPLTLFERLVLRMAFEFRRSPHDA
jgi:hypothetical protein